MIAARISFEKKIKAGSVFLLFDEGDSSFEKNSCSRVVQIGLLCNGVDGFKIGYDFSRLPEDQISLLRVRANALNICGSMLLINPEFGAHMTGFNYHSFLKLLRAKLGRPPGQRPYKS